MRIVQTGRNKARTADRRTGVRACGEDVDDGGLCFEIGAGYADIIVVGD